MSRDLERARRGFCPLPWMHLSANTDTTMRVCCNTDHGGHVRNDAGENVRMENVTSLSSAMNQKTHRDLRKAMLEGERPDFCRRCYREEDAGGVSVRLLYNRQYKGYLETVFDRTRENGEIEPEVTYVDFSLTNNCNLQCRMCSPPASYLLKKEFESLGFDFSKEGTESAKSGWDIDGNLGRIVEDVIPTLDAMLTTGGEPFVSPQHLKILEACVERGRAPQIVLRYHSNLTVLPPRLVELWKHFKSIEIHVSLEGVGEMNEYVRYPAKWEKIETNLLKLRELRRTMRIGCEVHTCLQAISWLRTHELLEWVFERSLEMDGLFPKIPYPIWVDQPYPMTLASLPPDLREEGSRRILSVLDRHQKAYEKGSNPNFELPAAASFRAAISRLKELPYNPQDFQAFLARTRRVDEFRGQNLINHVPEFASRF